MHGSGGTVSLGTLDSATAPTAYTGAASFVNVTAGSDTALNDCVSLPCTGGYFAISFNTVTFSGSQFRLYLSTNGFSQINTTAGQISDVLFGPTFNVGALTGTYTAVSGGYHIGSVAGAQVVEGPLPIQISNAYHFIKIYDGSSGAVAASIKLVGVLPGLTLTPDHGPAGTVVGASGGGFPSSKLIDLVYSATFTFWNGTTKALSGNWTTNINSGPGYWTKSVAIANVMQQINPPEGVILSVVITIQAKLQPLPHTSYGLPATFTEISGFLTQVITLDSSGSPYDTGTAPYSHYSMYGTYNGSSGSGLSTFLTVDAVSGGKLIVAGNDSMINGPVTVWVDGHLNRAKNGIVPGTQIGTGTATSSGHFNVTATLPSLALGPHFVFVSLGGVIMWFQIYVEPSLIVTPTHGPVGSTVTVTAFGFPSTCLQTGVVSGCKISMYWGEHIYGDETDYFIGNVTVGSNGQFNKTFTFVVPHTYGGYHDIEALPAYGGLSNSEYSDPVDEVAETSFYVDPTLVICKGVTCGSGSTNANTISVDANTRGLIAAVGTGYYSWQYVNMDGASFSDCETIASPNGDFYINFTAAGFRPGLHQVETWNCEIGDLVGAPNGLAYFNVTTTGDYVVKSIGDLRGLTTTLNTINTNVNTILGWQSTILGMNTNINTILGWQSTILGMNTNINTLLTSVEGLSGTSGTLTAISTKLDTISTSLGTISSAVSGVKTSVDTMAGQVGTMTNQVKSTQDSVSSVTTYVLVVAVLAAITLVLELAVLVRKLS